MVGAVVAVPVPIPAVDAAVRGRWDVGLKSWDKAPTSQSKCYICDKNIKAGELRFDYRLLKNRRVGDETRMHGTKDCMMQLPTATTAMTILMMPSAMPSANATRTRATYLRPYVELSRHVHMYKCAKKTLS